MKSKQKSKSKTNGGSRSLRGVARRKMATRIVAIPESRLEDFAAANGLEMVVTERRRPVGDPSRYYAHFDDCELKDGGMLVGVFGDGATPEAAIAAYAPKISLQRIVIGAQRRAPAIICFTGKSSDSRSTSRIVIAGDASYLWR